MVSRYSTSFCLLFFKRQLHAAGVAHDSGLFDLRNNVPYFQWFRATEKTSAGGKKKIFHIGVGGE
ncbi:hypothetical protein CHL67_02860 [Prosthecochloris sp. GSB1]|nr:hypothetical protein CHL67_02860 [Prosthecochloris sp. GSB1]